MKWDRKVPRAALLLALLPLALGMWPGDIAKLLVTGETWQIK